MRSKLCAKLRRSIRRYLAKGVMGCLRIVKERSAIRTQVLNVAKWVIDGITLEFYMNFNQRRVADQTGARGDWVYRNVGSYLEWYL